MRVIVIDDMGFSRDFIRQSLDNVGFKGDLDQAKDLKEGMAMLKDSLKTKNPYKLIITDLNLPDGLSIELVKKVRASKAYKNLPIILMTTEDPENQTRVLEAIEAGVNDYFFKPVDSLVLFEKIKRVFLGTPS